MLHILILKVTKFELPCSKRLSTVVKNIRGGHHASPPYQIELRHVITFTCQKCEIIKFREKIHQKSQILLTTECLEPNFY